MSQLQDKIYERIQQFCLFDDIFMSKCFEDNIECTELLLRILLGRDDLTVIEARAQSEIKNLQGRSVKLDIKARDAKNNLYDIEVQRDRRGANPKRARLYSATLDASALQVGDSVDMLPESYVIFITESDILADNRSIYFIERCIINDKGTRPFQDGSHIVYVNGALRDDTAIGRLMHDFACTNANDMYYETLANRVRHFKESKEGIREMSGIQEVIFNEGRQEGRLEGRQEGLLEGQQNNAVETALRMIRGGKLDIDEIAEYTGLPVEAVKDLAEPIKA